MWRYWKFAIDLVSEIRMGDHDAFTHLPLITGTIAMTGWSFYYTRILEVLPLEFNYVYPERPRRRQL